MPVEITDALVAALIAPLLGAMLYPALHTLPKATRIFDYFMFIAVPALVLYHVYSHAWPDTVAVAVLLLVGGMATPLLLERAGHLVLGGSRYLEKHTDSIAMIAGISGLALHVVVESAVLMGDSQELILALVLHRMGVGLMVYWLVRPYYGFLKACLAVGAILFGTLLGYTLLGSIMVDSETAEFYQFFVSGSLLHVIFHRSFGHHKHSG